MARLRVTVMLLAVWLVFLFNVERLDVLGINPPTIIYIFTAFAIIALLLIPEAVSIRWYFLLAPLLFIYALYRLPSAQEGELPWLAMISIECALITIAFAIVREVSANIANLERTYDTLVDNGDNLRILEDAAGEQAINQELFRARRYDRPVALLYVKTPSLNDLERIYQVSLPYQVALQHRYMQSRIAGLAESLLYSSDPIAWYRGDIVICLPETEKEQAYKLAQRIAKVMHSSLNTNVPIGVSAFPTEGLIFDDLVEQAREDLHYFTRVQVDSDSDDTLPTAPTSFKDQLSQLDYDETLSSRTEPYRPQEKAHSFLLYNTDKARLFARHWMYSLRDKLDLLPPQEFAFAALIDGKPYYNPDFWVNRLPPQNASGRNFYKYIKRAMDIALVVAAAPFILPLFAVVSFFIWLEDRGPIFYSQLRTGEGGHQFRLYKFRSMMVNGDAIKKELGIRTNDRGETVDGLGNKLKHDPRVTRVGHFIRKTSIDELPQLWNVLRGDMSLVGPRPTSYGVDKYTLFQTQRLSVKPGLTGLWQVYDRNDIDFDNRLLWDIKYIDKMSFWLDVQVLFHTFTTQVLKRKGA
jgi:lipopolysaccharide/colanic/teichoic acid biosynthesis glycosyltransferase